jgi:hypothetical protein
MTCFFFLRSRSMNFKTVGLVTFLSLGMLSFQAHGQSEDYNQGMREELSQDNAQLYPKRTKKTVRQTQTETVNENAVQPATLNPNSNSNRNTQVQIQQSPAPIYILQQPGGAPQQAQTQPTTTVESQARESRSDALRRQREDVEHQTEDKLTERLENDRLQSEKDRADRLFNPAVVAPQQAPVVVVAPAPAASPTPAPTPVPVPVVVAPVTEVAPVIITKDDEAPIKEEEASAKFSVGALAGIGSYPSLSNVSGSYAAGVQGNLQFAERFGVNLSTVFSNYNLQNVNPYSSTSYLVNVDQINVTGGADYHILDGRVSPVVGVLAGYTRRSFSSRVSFGPPDANTGSNAIDGGFLVGVDVRCTNRISVGADMRYMMNISYRPDNPLSYSNINNPYSYAPQTSPIESSSYYFATLNLKLAL